MTTPAYRKKVISDHAVCRYMERKHGADFDIVRREMMTPELATALAMDNERHKDGDIEYIIKNGKIVTVVPA